MSPGPEHVAGQLLGLSPSLVQVMLHEHPDGFALSEVVADRSGRPRDLRTLYANPSLAKHLGNSAPDRQRIEAAHDVVRNERSRSLLTYDAQRSAWLESYIFPVSGSVCGEFVRDVTELQLVEGLGVREFDGLTIDYRARRVLLGPEELDLTRSEFDVLAQLSRSPRVVVSTRDLLAARRGAGWSTDDNAVGIIISRLRRKLGERAGQPQRIKTVRGVGYRFDP